jgi:tetratricopeptide (TPR) repeat protein
VLLVLVGGALLARRYLGEVSPGLRPLSRHGMEGFLRYLWGDYAGAAAAYREHLRDAFTTAGLPADNEELALLEGDPAQARALALRALDRDPRASRSLLTLGEIALDENATQDAVRWIGSALSVAPDDVDGLLLASVAYARAGDYPRAIRTMSHVLRDWQGERRAMTFIRVLGETGRLYSLPADRRPACLLAHLHRYLRIYDGLQARLAIARAEEAIARGDQVDDAYVTLGVVYQKRTQDKDALAAFLRAIETNPRNAEAYRWAAVVYADRGELANEYRMARTAHEIEPGDPAYALPLAHVLAQKLGDYRAALELETKALATGREMPALLDDLGDLHGRLGHGDDALRFYQRAAMLAPRDPVHLRGLGWALALQDRYDDAVEALRRALALRPGWTEARYALALACRHAGRYDEAIPEFERAYREEPLRRWFLPDLCITYHLAGRFDRARACAEQYVSMAPGYPDMDFLRSFSLSAALDGRDVR